MQPERPSIPPVIGTVLPGEPAELSGLRAGDRIVSADGSEIEDWERWVKFVQARPGVAIDLLVERAGERQQIALTPAPYAQDEAVIGRIGASSAPVPGLLERYQVRYRMGLFEALPALSEELDKGS